MEPKKSQDAGQVYNDKALASMIQAYQSAYKRNMKILDLKPFEQFHSESEEWANVDLVKFIMMSQDNALYWSTAQKMTANSIINVLKRIISYKDRDELTGRNKVNVSITGK